LDFSDIVAQSGDNKPSIISLRVGDAKPQMISKILHSILPMVERELVDGAIISVEETQFRIKKLPV